MSFRKVSVGFVSLVVVSGIKKMHALILLDQPNHHAGRKQRKVIRLKAAYVKSMLLSQLRINIKVQVWIRTTYIDLGWL